MNELKSWLKGKGVGIGANPNGERPQCMEINKTVEERKARPGCGCC